MVCRTPSPPRTILDWAYASSIRKSEVPMPIPDDLTQNMTENGNRGLLRKQFAAIASFMKQRLLPLLVLAALLFGVFATPDRIHANDLSADHSTAQASAHRHADQSDGSDGTDKSSPCKAVVHHHCSAAISAEVHTDTAPLALAAGQLLSTDHRALPSLSRAPPIQPPSF